MTMEKHVVGQVKVTGTKNVNENCYIIQSPSIFLESLSYYYGCISREDAEWILFDEGCFDGQYLLRESGFDLVLSLCNNASVLHYRINKLPNGDVSLQGLPNQTFASPMKLIEAVDGLACKPSKPLKSSFGKCLPPTHWGLPEEIIRNQLLDKATDYGLTREQLAENLNCDLHFSSNFSFFVKSLIWKSLHELQPWYHFRLSRGDAEKRIESCGHIDGKFLVRERDESSYAICLSHEFRVKHYRIDILPSGNFAIQDGPKFDSIIALVSHYTIFSGGLWCMLGDGCPRPQEIIRKFAEQSSIKMANLRDPIEPIHSHCRRPFSGRSMHQRSRSIDRYQQQSDSIAQQQCKHCLQTVLSVHAANRRRRVSTPTNAKLKEWFLTINHKWARIKRQVILHNQRQQPLINEDNNDANDELSCCHVESAMLIKKSKFAQQKSLKQLRDMLLQCPDNFKTPQHHCKLHVHYLNSRFTDGYGTYGYRRQQFGRWHEEPAFGSRYAFDSENVDSDKEADLLAVNLKHSPKSNCALNTLKCPLHKLSRTLSSNEHFENLDNQTQLVNVYPTLMKSSSIDTITAFVSDPIEEIRRLHLPQANDENKLSESTNMIQTRSGDIINLDSPPSSILGSLKKCHNIEKLKLQRTNSFDGIGSNLSTSIAPCKCNCSDWLHGLPVDDPDDPFSSIEQSKELNAFKSENEDKFANKEIPENGNISDQNEKNGLALNDISQTDMMMDINLIQTRKMFNGSLDVLSNGFHTIPHFSETVKTKSNTSSSSFGDTGDTGSGSSSSCGIITSSSCKSSSSSGSGAVSLPFLTSANARPFSQTTIISLGSVLKNNCNQFSVTVSPKILESIENNNLNPSLEISTKNVPLQSDLNIDTSKSSISQNLTSGQPIIDLLKEFDVCFNSQDRIDDDSSTLTDNSTHSLASPLKRKYAAVNLCDSKMDILGNETETLMTAPFGQFGQRLQDPLPMTYSLSMSPNTYKSPMALSLSSSSAAPALACNEVPPIPPPNVPPPLPPPSNAACNSLSFSSTTQLQKHTANSLILSGFSNETRFQVNSSTVCEKQQVPSGLGETDRIINGKQQPNGMILSQINESNSHFNDRPHSLRPVNEASSAITFVAEELKDIEFSLICLNDEPEEVQESIRKYRCGPICFDPKCISLKRQIGNGYFGDVFLASIPSVSNSAAINLAVKMLKSHAVPQQKAEILREAQTMAKLDHRHIVRLIGVCEGDPFMLVMELAPLGPLNKYLQNYGQNMSENDILELMLQVAKAMQYLEEMNCVHRDLAARNVLLVNEKFAKVSDFGMSRVLGQGKDYYKARSASKWPLKWYAPECIYYYKFSSKSDVWSYGVALWEALSRGEMPYQGMDGQDILRMFSENRRLPKPESCPVNIYQLMWSCWQFKPENRVNFAAITDQLVHHLAAK